MMAYIQIRFSVKSYKAPTEVNSTCRDPTVWHIILVNRKFSISDNGCIVLDNQ